jgi:hypothetical protein
VSNCIFRAFFSTLLIFTSAYCLCACTSTSLRSDAASVTPPKRDPYVDALIREAKRQDLAHSRQWLRLGHYTLGELGSGFLGNGYESAVASAEFFLSARGGTDPDAELEATLRAFFAPFVTKPASLKEDQRPQDLHAICRFPARLLFLSKALNIDFARLPLHECPGYLIFITELDPQSVTLIFSSYFLNNPASAFGHTFLRVNKAHTYAMGQRRELLDYGIDFSADVDTSNALAYAIKGLTGMFPGTFKRIPYYYKVRQYNDYESRDLFEYDIRLEPEQLLMLVSHLWELGSVYFRYYYLSQNCSYQILALFDVANPSLDLMSRVSSPVLPADTVKSLFAEKDLIAAERYRPSLRTQFRARVAGLDAEHRNAIEALASNPDAPLPDGWSAQDRISVFDAATDLVDIRYGQELIDKTATVGARYKQRILERRAEILSPSAPLPVIPPWHLAPEAGHGSRRVGVGGAGMRGRGAPILDVRVALHDLADPALGYPELFSIEFVRARAQLWTDNKLELDDLTVARVTSLTAQSYFDHHLSWQFGAGGDTIDDSGCRRCFAPHLRGGVGAAFSFFDNSLIAFAMTGALIAWSPTLVGIAQSPVRVGIGPTGGIRIRWHPRAVTLLTGELFWLPTQNPITAYRVDAILRVLYTDALALDLEARASRAGYEGQFLQMIYF